MMGMLVTGTNKDILKISTNDFTLYISGSSENKKFKSTNNNKNINAKLEKNQTVILFDYNTNKVFDKSKTYTVELGEEDEV